MRVATAVLTLSFAALTAEQIHTDGNVIEALRIAQGSELVGRFGGVTSAVVVHLISGTEIPPRNELTIVKIAGEEFDLVEYRGGNHRQVSLIIPEDRFNKLPDGVDILVQHGRGESQGEKWLFRTMNKKALQR
jgi:hypothetical protein